MARILYALMGETSGHRNRALILTREMPRHEFLFAGGGEAAKLRELGYPVVDLPLLGTVYRDNCVDLPATIGGGIGHVLGAAKTVRWLAAVIREFDPHLILSDWEFFTPLAARKLGRECISFNHQHVTTHCRYTPPVGYHYYRGSFLLCGHLLYGWTPRYLIVSFYRPPPVNPVTTEVLPPLIRRDVFEHRVSDGEHVLVYQTTGTFGALPGVLESLGLPVIVYGMGERPARGKVTFKRRSSHGFLEDLASCRFAIVNGGHNVICEALHYGKPVFALPIGNQYEQMLNGHFLRKLGYGDYAMDLAGIEDRLRDFAGNAELYRERARAAEVDGNAAVCARLEALIA